MTPAQPAKVRASDRERSTQAHAPKVLFTILHHLAALAFGFAGAFGVLLLLVWMNTFTAPPQAEEAVEAVAIEIAPPPPPPPKPSQRPPPAPKPAETRAAPRGRTPPPSLLSGLAGVELGGAFASAEPVSGLGRTLLGEGKRDLVMTEEAVDSRPRRLSCPAAPYPASARAKGVKGHVVLRLLIGPDGGVERVKVVEAEPAGVFEAGAQEAMQRCRFEPAKYQGKPVKVWAEQRVVFKLGAGGLGG